MSRVLKSFLASAIVAFALFGTAGAASAVEPVDAPVNATGIVRSDVNDFFFDSFSADYYLDTDADGRSILTTVETFVAVFPEFDQNRGMRRAIPTAYQGAPTDISVQSVTDGEGNPRPYSLETDDDGFLLITSAANDYVHGEQTYVFTYTQHNVTRYFSDTDDDEFYWDTNGTGWGQSFGSISARVHVPTDLATTLTGDAVCYQGRENSNTQCAIASAEEADGTVFTATVENLGARENMTVVIGFQPHTFVPRDDSYLASPLSIVQILAVLGAIGAAIWAIVARVTALADGRGRPTIIAEYTPPKDIDLITASVILKKTKRGTAAQFVDFAVRRKIRIVETEKQGWFASGVTYLLELVDPSGLTGPQLNLAQALFGYQLQPGTGYLMNSKDATLSAHVRSIIASATTATQRDGIRKKGTVRHAILPVLLVILAATGSVVVGAFLLEGAIGGVIPFILMALPIVAVLLVFALVTRTPLTDKGAELRDHLKGLELYIRLAETDRLRMLQSPTGALREAMPETSTGASDPRQVVDVYEKLLPYAVLFDLEKEWAEELGKYYVDASPDWYSGSHAFNAAIFASSISSLSSSVSTSYSGSSSSSSSGGSGGGGSSGGGGGGGGGGGV